MKRSHVTIDTNKQALERFRRCHLLSGVSDDDFKKVLSKTRILDLTEGEVLFHRHQSAEEVFWVESGQIKLSVSSHNGSEKVIEVETVNTTFAEAILFDGHSTYPVQASAMKNAQIWCIDSHHYKKMLQNSPELCFAIMGKLSRRLHSLISEIDRLSLHNATYRVVAYLLDQIDSEERGSSQIHLNVPKHIMASRLSITPETLSRTFTKLCRSEHINMTESDIVIKDIESLRKFIHWDKP